MGNPALDYQVFDSGLGGSSVTGGGNITGAGTYISRPTNIVRLTHVGYVVTTTDAGSLAGTLTVEVNNDTDDETNVTGLGQGWTQYTSITIPAIAGATTFTLELLDLCFHRVRLKFVRSAGTGTINARISAKV